MITELFKLLNKDDINKKLFIFTVLTILNLFLFQLSYEKITINKYSKNPPNNISFFINEPFFPLEHEEHAKKEFLRTYYDSTNIRFHFQDLYKQRKLYKINYSYLPYLNVKRYNSYDKAADYIFESTGMLNITLLNYYYYNLDIDTYDFNHIHIGMSFDANYITLSKITIASILNTSSVNTYIHFHIGLNYCKYPDIKKLLDLNEINKNMEFIFYKGTQAELDFYQNGKKGFRGIGDYTRLLLPQIVNNTNRILILDSGDIIAQKDLSEIYFFELDDNYFAFSLEYGAGNFHEYYIFLRNNFYFNAGVCLVNIRKFREDNLYKNAFFAAIAYEHLPCPFQDIFLMISNYKFKYWSLNYNCPQFFENDKEMEEKTYNTSGFNGWLESQKKTIFRYNKEELMNAALDPVIIHLYFNKPYLNAANKRFTKMWIEYSRLAKVYEEIKIKFPQIFNSSEKYI